MTETTFTNTELCNYRSFIWELGELRGRRLFPWVGVSEILFNSLGTAVHSRVHFFPLQLSIVKIMAGMQKYCAVFRSIFIICVLLLFPSYAYYI